MARRRSCPCARAKNTHRAVLESLGGSVMEPRLSRSLVIASVLALTVSISTAAQEVQDTTRLKELVVTATRMPTHPDAVVSSITTISGEDLRARGLHFVQDALREVPGATVVQVGSFGGVSSLF